jgi:Transposase DDE domain
MGTVRQLADEVERGLADALPGLRKTVVKKLALAVGAMIEGRTPNTVELANLLPLETERQDMREQWLRRLLKNPLLLPPAVMAPVAREELARAARNGQTLLLSMDQTDLGDRMAILMVSLRVGDRALPVAWLAAEGPANIGFERQRRVLEQVRAWLPEGTEVLLSADRFDPSADLFAWLGDHDWGYRLRLKGNLLVDTGRGDETTTGALARGVTERSLTGVRLFAQGVMTNLGILHEASHPEPWIIAMDCAPTRATVRDSGARWAIEPMFSDLKGRGFDLEDSQLEHADRLERLLLIMSLAMYWCVRVGRDDALHSPTPLEKKTQAQTDPDHWSFRKLHRSLVSWFTRGLRRLKRCLQNGIPLPSFHVAMRN